MRLAKPPVFSCFPENVRELHKLLKDGRWTFKRRVAMPSFTRKAPEDQNEVLSWDERYVLTGTNVENMAVIPRDRWDAMCRREQTWFES